METFEQHLAERTMNTTLVDLGSVSEMTKGSFGGLNEDQLFRRR